MLKFLLIICSVILYFNPVLTATAHAATDAEAALAANRAMAVASNEIVNWPTGPVIGAESAILIEAETGTILYSKNIHEKQYPASTTKLLTTLMASELCKLDEIVHFSHDAVFDTPRDSSHIAMDVGQALTMEQSLNAILIRSANEVSFAVAEHITGTTDWSVFAGMMNERAKELGCLNSNFVNPNGLPDDNHYTTAYDLAMIGRAFFANEMLCNITLTRRLQIPASDMLPQEKLELNAMKIIPGGEYAYEYLVGCKTGYTDTARSCLVSCAEKDGMRLICVVLRDEAPYQYEDTITLFDYGFSNFSKVNVAQSETKYDIGNTGLFYSGNDIFGNSQPILSLNKDDFIVLPRTISFEDTETKVSYETEDRNQAAMITYTYQGVELGTVKVNFAASTEESYVFDSLPEETTPPAEEKEPSVIFVNIMRILIVLGILVLIGVIAVIVRIVMKNYSFADRRRRYLYRKRRRQQNRQRRQDLQRQQIRRRRRAKRSNRFRDYDY